jgi:hypothetical protein
MEIAEKEKSEMQINFQKQLDDFEVIILINLLLILIEIKLNEQNLFSGIKLCLKEKNLKQIKLLN